MQSFLDRLQTRRSILKRTRPRQDLPALALYLEMAPGAPKRRVLDTEGKEHLVDDIALQSLYKLVTGREGKELMEKHWPNEKPKT